MSSFRMEPPTKRARVCDCDCIFTWHMLLPELQALARTEMTSCRRWLLGLTCKAELALWIPHRYKIGHRCILRFDVRESGERVAIYDSIPEYDDILVEEGRVRLIEIYSRNFPVHDRITRHEMWIHDSLIAKNLDMATWLISDPRYWIPCSHSCDECITLCCTLPLTEAFAMLPVVARAWYKPTDGRCNSDVRWNRFCYYVTQAIIDNKRPDLAHRLQDDPPRLGDGREIVWTERPFSDVGDSSDYDVSSSSE
jgi:hypothetical protein